MTIKQLVDDGLFLADAGRFVGALTTLLAAVSGSSRKVFPKDVAMSRSSPGKKMGDREAFTLFLGGRLNRVMCLLRDVPEEGASAITFWFAGKQQHIEDVLYEQFRCSLSHNGVLPAKVDFKESGGFDRNDRSYQIFIDPDFVCLQRGWINLLVEVVVQARCNAAEFGLKHHELRPKAGVDASAVFQRLKDEFGVSQGRANTMRWLVEFVGPEAVLIATAEQLTASLKKAIALRLIPAGPTGFASRGLATDDGLFTQKGLEVARVIADAYDLVDVT